MIAKLDTLVEHAIDVLTTEAEPEELRTRPGKHGETLKGFANRNTMMEEVRGSIAALQSTLSELEREDAIAAKELMIALEEFEDREMRLGDLVAKLEEIEAKKSKIPRWGGYTKELEDMVIKLGAKTAAQIAEMKDSFKATTPAHPELVVTKAGKQIHREIPKLKRETIEIKEGIVGRILEWLRVVSRRWWDEAEVVENEIDDVLAEGE